MNDATKNNSLPPSVSPDAEKTSRADHQSAARIRFAEAGQGAATGRALGAGVCAGLLASLLMLWFAPVLREWIFAVLPESKFAIQLRTTDIKQLQKEARSLEKRAAALRKKHETLTPRAPYLIVNTSGNRIQVMKGNELLHEGMCSTGSYILLKAADERQWIFQTPRGMFRVRGKSEYPVWKKPDWAFIEDGLPVPPPNAPERFEYGVLGEYALALGDGYLIHGTLYKRMLGMPVTHGCVRLGDEDLRIVYKNLQFGSKVFIY